MLSIYDGRQCLYQWETGRALLVSNPIIERVLFSNITTPEALPVDVVEGAGGLRIAFVPDELLQTSWDINAFAICGEGCTRAELLIPVKARAKPAEYVYAPTEIANYNSLAARIAALEKSKLSDFENDLWYTKTEPKLTITKDEFIYDADEGICYYKGTPGLDWFAAPDKIGFSVACLYEENGETYSDVYNHFLPNADTGYDETESCDRGYFDEQNRLCPFVYCDYCGIQIVTGMNRLNRVELEPEDAFYIVTSWFDDDDNPGFDSITLYHVDEKKVPIEFCDTSEIEEEIEALTEEVYNL